MSYLVLKNLETAQRKQLIQTKLQYNFRRDTKLWMHFLTFYFTTTLMYVQKLNVSNVTPKRESNTKTVKII